MFKTLYKLDSRQKVRQWTIKIEGDCYWTEKGLVGGKITHSKKTKAIGKNIGKANQTSPEEQAIVQARARYKKKLDEGYVEKQSNLGNLSFYRPMLARDYDDIKKLTYPVYSQPKLDGIRCLVRLEGGVLLAKSRQGKRIDSIPHVLEELKPIFKQNPELVLDGELYNHQFKDNFNKIVSLVRKQRPKDKSKIPSFEKSLEESRQKVQYWVYDVPRINSEIEEAELFLKRYDKAIDLLKDLNYTVRVDTSVAKNSEQLDKLFDKYEKHGYEGQIIRKNSSYENKRSKNLLKRKKFKDKEYLVVDVLPGKGNKSGIAGSLICKDLDTGAAFKSNIKSNFQELGNILAKKQSYIGKLVTIKYFQLTPDGIPRFPYAVAFRDYE